MAESSQKTENQKIAKLLLEAELLEPEDLKQAEHLASLQNKGLMEVLLEIGALTNEQMGQFMAMYYGVPYANLRQMNVDVELMKQLPEAFADAQQVVLFKKDNLSRYVAAVQPNNPKLRALLEKKFGSNIRWFYSNPNDLKQALHMYHGDEQTSLKEIEAKLLRSDEDSPSQMLEFVDGVFEMLEVDGEIRKLIIAQESSDQIKEKAVEKGMVTMFDDAIEKVNQGKTSLLELLRVVRE